MYSHILSAVRLHSDGIKCSSGSCAFSGQSSTETIDIKLDGCIKGEGGAEAIQQISIFAKEQNVGKSLLAKGLFRRFCWY
ncbi:hypothetical protein GCM10007169_17680 [Shewanella fodinae]|nr:hypothetical protein GCM10007169_17680 [Shewanella fodinae]